MILTWFPVALVALFLWILGNIIDKYLVTVVFRNSKDDEDISVLMIFSVFAALPILLSVFFFWNDSILYNASALVGIGTGLLNVGWLWFYLKSIARSELSRIVPFFQLVPFFGLFFGWFFLKEFLTEWQLIAGFISISGALVLSYHHRTNAFDWKLFAFMTASAFLLSMQTIVFKLVYTDSNYAHAIFWSSVGLMVGGTILVLSLPGFIQKARKLIRGKSLQAYTVNIFNEFVDNAASLVFLYAALLGPVALVQTINAYQPALILLVTFIATKCNITFLSEDHSPMAFAQKIIGISLTICGGILVYTFH